MKKETFFREIKEILLLGDVEIAEDTVIDVDSMSNLLLIVFFDENFSKTITSDEMKQIKTVKDLIVFAGEDKLT